MDTNTLKLEITETFTLERFEIVSIKLIPKVSANIDVRFYGNNDKIYDRTFSLTGQDYLDWGDDAYLYHYIQKNVEEIFRI